MFRVTEREMTARFSETSADQPTITCGHNQEWTEYNLLVNWWKFPLTFNEKSFFFRIFILCSLPSFSLPTSYRYLYHVLPLVLEKS
jgi:hypothetical protein